MVWFYRIVGTKSSSSLRLVHPERRCYMWTIRSPQNAWLLGQRIISYLLYFRESGHFHADSSGRAVWGVGLDRLHNEIMVQISPKAWMFVLVFLCCVVLCRYRSLRRADHSSKGILPSAHITLGNLRCVRRRKYFHDCRTTEDTFILILPLFVEGIIQNNNWCVWGKSIQSKKP
jgi:hypothetical protein